MNKKSIFLKEDEIQIKGPDCPMKINQRLLSLNVLKVIYLEIRESESHKLYLVGKVFDEEDDGIGFKG
jgi:hypothetical protein